jgi:hypothetical protein
MKVAVAHATALQEQSLRTARAHHEDEMASLKCVAS